MTAEAPHLERANRLPCGAGVNLSAPSGDKGIAVVPTASVMDMPETPNRKLRTVVAVVTAILLGFAAYMTILTHQSRVRTAETLRSTAETLLRNKEKLQILKDQISTMKQDLAQQRALMKQP